MMNSHTEISNLIFDILRNGDMRMAYLYIKTHYKCETFSEMTLAQLKDYLKALHAEIEQNGT